MSDCKPTTQLSKHNYDAAGKYMVNSSWHMWIEHTMNKGSEMMKLTSSLWKVALGTL